MWKKDKISNLCNILGGKPAPKDNSGAFDSDGIPFVRMRDLGRYHLTTNLTQTDDSISFDYALKHNLKPAPKGAILLPRSGSVALNHRAILAKDSIIVSHICALIVKNDKILSNRFLYYWLSTYDMNKIAKKTTGLDAINFSDLGKIEMPIPDLETQKKIVAILDKAKTILDKRVETIQKYDELLKGIFIEMFGDVPNNPQQLPKKQLKEFGDVITGNTPPRSDNANYDSNFIEWIKTDNIFSETHILSQASEYLSEAGFERARYVEEKSLLVACIAGSINSIGRSAITDRRVTFNQQINALVPNPEVSVYFLYWMFKVSAEYIQSFATGGMKRLLTKGKFEKILFLKPSYEEQLRFEKIAVRYSNFILKVKKHQAEAEILLKSLSQQVFSERIIVDVDAELEGLINSINLEDYSWKNKKIFINVFKKTTEDITFLQRLIDKLDEQEIIDSFQYDKAKSIVFRALKKDKILKQGFDEKSKRVKLTIR